MVIVPELFTPIDPDALNVYMWYPPAPLLYVTDPPDALVRVAAANDVDQRIITTPEPPWPPS